MQRKIIALVLVLLMTSNLPEKAAQYERDDSSNKKCFVGSTLFLPGNLKVNSTRPVRPDSFLSFLGFKSEGPILALSLPF